MPHSSHWRTSKSTPASRSSFPTAVSSHQRPEFSKAVFLVGRHPETLQPIEKLLTQLKCEVQWFEAAEHICASESSYRSWTTAEQRHPCLIIVADTDPQWVEQSIYQLRPLRDIAQVTIVTLSDRQQAANGQSAIDQSLIDGYLVNPVQRSVLGTLVHSAVVRQFFHQVSAA